MRKFFGYVIIVSLLFSLVNFCEAKPKKKKVVSTKHKIEFVSRDKFLLVGDLYLANPETQKPLVICLHSYSMNAQVWKNIAEKLRKEGYNVLAPDIRGHGRSIYNEKLKLKSRFQFDEKDWQKVPRDVLDSIKYVRLNYPKINTDDVILMGADIGAQAVAQAGIKLAKAPLKMILISPMFEFKGISMPLKTTRLKDTLMLLVMAKTDRFLYRFDTKTKPIFKYYPKGGPGIQVLQHNQEAFDDVFNFITK